MSERMQALAVIGGGNMAQAIVRGGLDQRALRPGRVVIAELDDAKRDLLRGWGVRVVRRASEAIALLSDIEPARGAGQVMLAVKPQILPEVAADLAGLEPPGAPRVVISILAGAPSRVVRTALGDWARVVRVMPNLPARIRRGISAVAVGAGAAPGDEAQTLELFRGVGEVVALDESLMDAFTSVAGSGPAYLFLLAEAMAAGAREVGFDGATADRIVRATLGGAGELLAQAEEPPAELRRAVTSRGGTTAAALDVLERRAVRDAIIRAIEAARDRGSELARLAGGGSEVAPDEEEAAEGEHADLEGE